MPDASAAVEYLLRTDRGQAAATVLDTENLVAPELLDAEVLSILRRHVQRAVLTVERAEVALDLLATWRVRRLAHLPLLQAAWAHRDNYSAYDALYVAAAQTFGARLVTGDARLVRAPRPPGLEVTLV